MKNLIFILDDDEIFSEALQLILEGEGYPVARDHDTKEVITKIKKLAPRLIILDYYLPGKNGILLTKLIKKDDKTKDIPIILTSANLRNPQKAFKAGISSFLSKPFNIQELVNLVKKFMPI